MPLTEKPSVYEVTIKLRVTGEADLTDGLHKAALAHADRFNDMLEAFDVQAKVVPDSAWAGANWAWAKEPKPTKMKKPARRAKESADE